jgi:Ca2+-binding RTX toxin-like protein
VTGAAPATLSDFNAQSSSIEVWLGNGKGLFGTSAANVFDFSWVFSTSGLPFIDAGAGNDTIIGPASDNIIIGGRGRDVLTGGGGGDSGDTDMFDFNSVKESVKGSNRDVITDFTRSKGDRIDLRDIDADTSSNSGNDKFKFIKTADFKGGGGELRYNDNGSTCTVQADVNGDKKADFEIRVNVGSLIAGDFFL